MAKQIKREVLAPNHVDLVIGVCFISSQRGLGEDLYKVETGAHKEMVLARQDLDKRLVRWCTATKWSGGYEASCPLKPGITINAHSPSGNITFSEKTYRTDWNGTGLADKKHPFSWEEVEQDSSTG